jgi:hypothetical protein
MSQETRVAAAAGSQLAKFVVKERWRHASSLLQSEHVSED